MALLISWVTARFCFSFHQRGISFTGATKARAPSISPKLQMHIFVRGSCAYRKRLQSTESDGYQLHALVSKFILNNLGLVIKKIHARPPKKVFVLLEHSIEKTRLPFQTFRCSREISKGTTPNAEFIYFATVIARNVLLIVNHLYLTQHGPSTCNARGIFPHPTLLRWLYQTGFSL